MKIKTFLVAAMAGGVGYVLGTKAGRARFEQIRGQAQDFLKSPTVQDTVANLSETVKQNAAKLPDPVANVVTAVADKAKSSKGTDSTATDSSVTDSSVSDSTATEVGATDLGTATGTPSTTTGATLTDSPGAGRTFIDPTIPDPSTPKSPPHSSSPQ